MWSWVHPADNRHLTYEEHNGRINIDPLSLAVLLVAAGWERVSDK